MHQSLMQLTTCKTHFFILHKAYNPAKLLFIERPMATAVMTS